MELIYKSERELHNVVVTAEVTFIGDPEEWRELVAMTRGSLAASMLRSLENVCAQYEVDEESD